MAVAAFVMYGTMAAGTVVFYSRIPSLTRKYISDLKTELTKAVLDQVPIPEIPKMPTLPTETGPAIKSPFQFRPAGLFLERPSAQAIHAMLDLLALI